MDAAARRPLDAPRVHALDADALRARERERFLDAAVAARPDAQPPHAAGAQRLEHGIDAVDDHGYGSAISVQAHAARS